MVNFETIFGRKKLQISSYAENVVRIRVSENFEPTLFEQYKIYRAPEETGEAIAGGVQTGKLKVTYEDGKITFASDKFSRVIDLDNSKVQLSPNLLPKLLEIIVVLTLFRVSFYFAKSSLTIL